MKTELTIEGDTTQEGAEEIREGEKLLRAFNSCISLSKQNTAITMTLFLPVRHLSRNLLNTFLLSGKSKQGVGEDALNCSVHNLCLLAGFMCFA
jgi:hypothetical protein